MSREGYTSESARGPGWPCEADGCLGRGKGKPYCVRHIYLMPSAQEIRAELERQKRNAKARARRAERRAS